MAVIHTSTQAYTPPFRPFSMSLRGRLVEVVRPWVAAVVNATPDSFHADSRAGSALEVAHMAEAHILGGADMIDIGACSTRPGSKPPSPDEERRRLEDAVKAVRKVSADIPISVDTWRADIARRAVEDWGADIVNDISGGSMDPAMDDTIASLRVPYIVTHMRGTPEVMNAMCGYDGSDGVVADIILALSRRIEELRLKGVADIIADPGFGFAKTSEQGFETLRELPRIVATLDVPLMAGLSRKSMLYRPLGITAADALAATIAANTLALAAGAAFIRVHDAEAARQCRDIVNLTFK